MGGLLLLSKLLDCVLYTLETHSVDLQYQQFAPAESVHPKNGWRIKLIPVFPVTSAVCTPVGLSRMFTVMGQLLVKPTVSDQNLCLFYSMTAQFQ